MRARAILRQQFDVIDARAVPRSEGFPYGNIGKLFETAVLYTDLRGSTELADRNRRVTTAKILKVYLNEMTRTARFHDAQVRGFAGDRVMVIFEKSENAATKAVDVAVTMRDIVRHALNPALQANVGEVISIGVGIDYGLVLAARVGMPRNPDLSDLVWAGGPANHASKLTDTADPDQILVSDSLLARVDQARYPGAWWTRVMLNLGQWQVAAHQLRGDITFGDAIRQAGLG